MVTRCHLYLLLISAVFVSGCAGILKKNYLNSTDDLTGDAVPEVVEVRNLGSYDRPLISIKIASERESTNNLYPGWKVRIADLDNDNKKEILIALSKIDYRDNQLRNRLYVYNWDRKMLDKWRGSRFPRAFVDFDVIDINGKNFLRLLEVDDEHQFYLSRYKWLHFGFVLLSSERLECELSIPAGQETRWYKSDALSSCLAG